MPYSTIVSLLETPIPSVAQGPSALWHLAAAGPDGHGGVLHHGTQRGSTLASREKGPLKSCKRFNGNKKSGVLP